jgi:hypothetical protein
MIEITSGMGRKFTGLVGAVALAAILVGCAKQEPVMTAQTDTQAVAQSDIPEVIVTASRDSAAGSVTARHE